MKNILEWLKNLFKTIPLRPENSGLLSDELRPTDWIVGVNSQIIFKNRLSDGDWSKYIFDKRPQWCWYLGKYVDWMICTCCSDRKSVV